ncbi:hypothetical protein HAX54_003263, partial [Datura stramonium]|nr:hypothetical protein [Datura stramonium]
RRVSRIAFVNQLSNFLGCSGAQEVADLAATLVDDITRIPIVKVRIRRGLLFLDPPDDSKSILLFLDVSTDHFTKRIMHMW